MLNLVVFLSLHRDVSHLDLGDAAMDAGLGVSGRKEGSHMGTSHSILVACLLASSMRALFMSPLTTILSIWAF